MFISESNYEDNGMNRERLIPMTRKQELSFPLDLVAMHNAQLNDEPRLVIVRKHIADSHEMSDYITLKKPAIIKNMAIARNGPY